jgi:hypothetical protein
MQRAPYGYDPTQKVREFRGRVREGNLLLAQHIVVPIKEGGLAYGSVSTQFLSLYPGVEIPDLEFRQARTIVLDREHGRTVTFVCFWNDNVKYDANHISICANRAIVSFSTACMMDPERFNIRWLDEDRTLSLPLFKGCEGSPHNVACLEVEICDTQERLDRGVICPCEVEIVVRNKERVPS